MAEGNCSDQEIFSVRDTNPETADEAIARLAKLPLLEYERVREDEAKRRGCRTSILDKLVHQARDANAPEAALGQPLRISSPEPWHDPIAGEELLNAIAAFFGHHAFLPSHVADTLAVWTLHTYNFRLFRHTPRIAITSPVPLWQDDSSRRAGALSVQAALNCQHHRRRLVPHDRSGRTHAVG